MPNVPTPDDPAIRSQFWRRRVHSGWAEPYSRDLGSAPSFIITNFPQWIDRLKATLVGAALESRSWPIMEELAQLLAVQTDDAGLLWIRPVEDCHRQEATELVDAAEALVRSSEPEHPGFAFSGFQSTIPLSQLPSKRVMRKAAKLSSRQSLAKV
jgi:hypothetical protein